MPPLVTIASSIGLNLLIVISKFFNISTRFFLSILFISFTFLSEFILDFCIIIGINLATKEEIFNAIRYITGKEVTELNYHNLINTCRNYILEKYSYLENINMFINSDSSDNIKEAFLNIVCNAKMDICKIRPIGA